jgi:hypothetical protein
MVGEVSQRIYSRLPLQLNQLLMCNMSHLCRVAALFIRRGGIIDRILSVRADCLRFF